MRSIQWVIDALYRKQEIRPKKVSTNQLFNHTRKLRYCVKCGQIWEITLTKVCMRYKHLPKYGIKKKVCTYCKG